MLKIHVIIRHKLNQEKKKGSKKNDSKNGIGRKWLYYDRW